MIVVISRVATKSGSTTQMIFVRILTLYFDTRVMYDNLYIN